MGVNLFFYKDADFDSEIGSFRNSWEILAWLEEVGTLDGEKAIVQDEYKEDCDFFKLEMHEVKSLKECCQRIINDPRTAKEEMEHPKGEYDQNYFDTIDQINEMLEDIDQDIYVYVS